MTNQEISKLKKEGQREKLLSVCSARLWNAKKYLDQATCDNFKVFTEKINEALTLINDAKQLFDEAEK